MPSPGPYAGFEGRVDRTFARSEGWWPSEPTAPDGAPNVIIIMIDDLGYSDLGCYGSEIPTPNIDRLADGGLRYTNFHVNPMCSPTRASLLTGLNAHDAGVGFVAECDPGFPGYAGEMTRNAATLAELFVDNGYSTMMSGKWHLTKPQNKNAGGSKHSWPVQRGFQEFYGILNGFTNFHHPDRLIDGNSVLDIDEYPEDYYLTDDLTDRAIRMMRGTKSENPSKPFFLYMAHPAVHAPLQARADDIARHRGNYDRGWDDVRATRFARQKELGILPDAALAPRNTEPDHDVDAWDDLPEDRRAVYARYMEVYAAMVDSVDQNVGRLIDAVAELGELDNTIILFTSDNGASREGEAAGSTQYFEILPPAMVNNHERDLAMIDKIGGPETLPHYPRGWAMACNTPLRLYKTHTHAGGHQVPMILHWPAHIGGGGEIREQYTHVTDVMPTLLELIGLERPDARHGVPLKPLAGASFAASIGDDGAPAHHHEQYYENSGHRGIYRDGWEAVTVRYPRTNFSDEPWELFNVAADPSQATDLSSEHPDKLDELKQAFHEAAERYQVYPLDEGAWIKMIDRPDNLGGYEEPVTILPGTPSLEHWRAGRLVQFRSWSATASLEYKAGDQGVLFAHGDQGGGYSVWVEDGELTFCANDFGIMHHVSGGLMPVGATTVRVAASPAEHNTFNVELFVDDRSVGAGGGFRSYAGIAPFQGIDVGLDRRSPVSWAMREKHGTFPWTGTLHSVRYEPGPYIDTAGVNMIEVLREMARKYD